MTGPEHFGAAEAHLQFARDLEGGGDELEQFHLAAAQVHATLALAAVTAAAELSLTSLGKDRPIEAWREVIL